MTPDNSSDKGKSLFGKTASVVALKAFEYVGLILFVLLIPKAMGPKLYGALASLLSITILSSLVTDLGGAAIFGRYAAEFETTSQSRRLRILFSQLFWIRTILAGLISVIIFFAVPQILPVASTFTAAATAGAFFCLAVSATCYQLFYGLNDFFRWLLRGSLQRLAFLALLYVLGGINNLEQTSIAIFFSELLFLLVGIVWARPYFIMSRSVFDVRNLTSVLGFGAMFLFTHVAYRGIERGGEALLLLFSVSTESIAYFSLANSVALTFDALFIQLAAMIVPSITRQHVSGNSKSVNSWSASTLKYLTIASFALLFLVLPFGESTTEYVFGSKYLQTAANLKLLAIGLLATPILRISLSIAVATSQPRQALIVALAMGGTFLVASFLLIPHFKSHGAAAALAIGYWIAAATACWLFSLKDVLAEAKLLQLGLCGSGLSVLIGLQLIPALVAGIIALPLYACLLIATKVITVDDWCRVSRALPAWR